MRNITNYINETLSKVDVNNLPDMFYHATPACNLTSIKKYGLGGKMPKHRWWDYENTEYKDKKQGVFLATDDVIAYDFLSGSDEFDEFAEEYEERYDKELEILVFAIHKNDLNLSRLSIDNNFDDDDNPTYFYDGVIPYNKLKKVDTSDYAD